MTVLFSNLWCFGNLLKTVMPKINAQAGSMVGTTCSFNEINTNKEEKYCHAKAFLRPVKEDDLVKDLEEIKKIAKKYDIELVPAENNECFKSTDVNSKSVEYTKKCINDIFPDVIPAPYILPAGTDARHLCEISESVIRFAPIEMNDQQFASVHSENEHISLEAIANCVVFYKHYLKNYR
jgi:carboxypeptidase PM20D1